MTKTIVGYCDPFSVQPGQLVQCMVSVEDAGPCPLELVRLICGDPSSKGPGFREEVIARPDDGSASWPTTIAGRTQALHPGSSVTVADHPFLEGLASCTLSLLLHPTRAGDGRQRVVGLGALELFLDHDARLGVSLAAPAAAAPAPAPPPGAGEDAIVLRAADPLRLGRWWRVTVSFDHRRGRIVLQQLPLPTRSPSDRLLSRPATVELTDGRLIDWRPAAGAGADGSALRFAGSFDGRIEAPLLVAAALEPDALCDEARPLEVSVPAEHADRYAAWDFAQGIGTNDVVDTGPLALHGRTQQGPARAVTGARWDGSVQRWQDDPAQYGAIHFHRDDLTDAGWQPDVSLVVPDDLPSGIYAFRVTSPAGDIDRSPFVVRPPAGRPRAPLALLLPTATYWAYANHRMTISGAEFFPSRARLRPEFQYLKDHPEAGYSMYEHHDDGSGVMLSSRRRPILNLKPGADGWAFTADTNLVAYLTALGEPFDVITDDDLHREGRSLLDGYRVVMTGSHPEYWSTAMLDALEGWLGDGGRLMYLGGNGFYWRVAWSDEEPWVMEVRRAEDGTRGWIAEPGEYYHQFGGEYGGLWRRLGRAPNKLVGVGFAAQGFDRASPYRRTPASVDGPAAWVFAGVEGEVIGDFGIGGGAAGQEIDRYDPRLGSPRHAQVLATSFDHSAEMLRTKEEFLATALIPDDPNIRADVVFFEGPNGGAVFSVGSIAWYGALAHQGYRNDIATITTNVVRRFLDPAPWPATDPAPWPAADPTSS